MNPEDKTTITDNEVIGAFDGREDGYDEHGVWQKLKYNSDWRDLMPVWYKFKDLTFNTQDDHVTHSNHRIAIGSAILSKGIGEACKLLVEGIRWYNSVKK